MGQPDRMPSWVPERKRLIIAERWCCLAPIGSGSLRRLRCSNHSADPAPRRPAGGAERGLIGKADVEKNGRRSRPKICSGRPGAGSSPAVSTTRIASS